MTTNIEAEATSREQNNAALIGALDQPPPADAESTLELDVMNDNERGRWIASLGPAAIGELEYRFVGGRVVLLTTWVDPAYRNRRVATELIARVLNEVRETGKKITVICPVVGEFIARHHQYVDLIDKVHPGAGAYPKHEPVGGPADQHGSDNEKQITAFEQDVT